MSDKNQELCTSINIKFCIKIGRSSSEMSAILTLAYAKYAMKKSSVFEWHRLLKEGRQDVQADSQIREGQNSAYESKFCFQRVIQRIKLSHLV
jgi:hypothetical protein